MIASIIFKVAIAAAALSQGAVATTYANFCDDNGCSVNCGESVSVDNPGCLNESGRGSFVVHDVNAQNVNLVFSPEPDCPCQNYCMQDVLEGTLPLYNAGGDVCINLAGTPGAQSFRFVGNIEGSSNCADNNCPY